MIKCNFEGRLGNILLQNIGLSIISKKFNLKVENYKDNFDIINLSLNNGNIINKEYVNFYDSDLLDLLKSDKIDNGIIYNGNFQIKEFVLEYRYKITDHFNPTYSDKNNDLFVHVRLDDITHYNPGLEYYRKSIKLLNYENGYISSDSPNHYIVQSLINEFNLTLYNNTPIETINFGKNFNNIVLSKGTFSWWIGLLSKAENILYPVGDQMWYGDIFVYDDWKKIQI